MYQTAKWYKGIIISPILRYKAYRNLFVQCTRLLYGTKLFDITCSKGRYHFVRHLSVSIFVVALDI